MQTTRQTIALAIGAVLGMSGLSGGASAADVRCAEQERCYGVSKAGKNDCATSTAACSGSATQDYQKDAWVYVPKGTCVKLAGGALASPAAAKKK